MIEFDHLDAEPNTLRVAGHIDNVLQGRVPQIPPISAHEFAYAFEIGSPTSLDSLGEMVALNETVYTHSTQTDSLTYGSELHTTCALIIPHEAKPNLRITCTTSITLNNLLLQIQEELGAPFAYAGTASLDRMRSWAISEPPIHNEVLFDREKRYYPKSPTKSRHQEVALIGAASLASPLMDPVLYHNPHDKEGALRSHTHALILSEKSSLESINPTRALDVVHLFPDSLIAEASLLAYSVRDLSTYRR